MNDHAITNTNDRQSRAALLTAACLGLTSAAALLVAAPAVHAEDASFSATVSAGASGQLTGLDALVAPIALYPDPLLGIVLPAATAPDDIQAAVNVSDTASLDSQSWQPAVKDLAHYHVLVQWMASNQDWTAQLGAAYADQPQQVFDSIQDLRRRAVAAGALVSNDKIEVVQDNGIIQILPREMNQIYIPQYDAEGIYVRGHAGVSISFGAALPAGDWLAFYPVWSRHAIYSGNWYAYSRDHGGWHHDAVQIGFFGRVSGVSGGSEFRVSNRSQLKEGSFHAAQGGNYARPTAFTGSASGAAVGYQAGQREGARNSTFSGDQRNREQFNAQQNEQNRDQTNREQMNRDQQDRAGQNREQQNADQQKSDEQKNEKDRHSDEQRSRQQQDQQRNADQFRGDQRKDGANGVNNGTDRNQSNEQNRMNQGQLQGDTPNRNQTGSSEAAKESDRNSRSTNTGSDSERTRASRDQNKDQRNSASENGNSASPSAP